VSNTDKIIASYDWTKFDALTDEDIEASVRDDPDAPPIVDEDWFTSATIVTPEQKKAG
jgi:hypothetical protein